MANKCLRIKTFPIFFLSFAWVGFLPTAPGTWASFAALIVPLIFKLLAWNWLYQLPFFLATTILGIWLAERVQKQMGLHDPGWIVIDEVLGIWIGSWFLPQITVEILLTQFVAFRFFDILKVWPANVIDKKMLSGLGVMLDDIVAGVYAGLLTLLLFYLKNFI